MCLRPMRLQGGLVDKLYIAFATWQSGGVQCRGMDLQHAPAHKLFIAFIAEEHGMGLSHMMISSRLIGELSIASPAWEHVGMFICGVFIEGTLADADLRT